MTNLPARVFSFGCPVELHKYTRPSSAHIYPPLCKSAPSSTSLRKTLAIPENDVVSEPGRRVYGGIGADVRVHHSRRFSVQSSQDETGAAGLG